jgi:hypothetical protein
VGQNIVYRSQQRRRLERWRSCNDGGDRDDGCIDCLCRNDDRYHRSGWCWAVVHHYLLEVTFGLLLVDFFGSGLAHRRLVARRLRGWMIGRIVSDKSYSGRRWCGSKACQFATCFVVGFSALAFVSSQETTTRRIVTTTKVFARVVIPHAQELAVTVTVIIRIILMIMMMSGSDGIIGLAVVVVEMCWTIIVRDRRTSDSGQWWILPMAR